MLTFECKVSYIFFWAHYSRIFIFQFQWDIRMEFIEWSEDSWLKLRESAAVASLIDLFRLHERENKQFILFFTLESLNGMIHNLHFCFNSIQWQRKHEHDHEHTDFNVVNSHTIWGIQCSQRVRRRLMHKVHTLTSIIMIVCTF